MKTIRERLDVGLSLEEVQRRLPLNDHEWVTYKEELGQVLQGREYKVAGGVLAEVDAQWRLLFLDKYRTSIIVLYAVEARWHWLELVAAWMLRQKLRRSLKQMSGQKSFYRTVLLGLKILKMTDAKDEPHCGPLKILYGV